MHHLDSHKMFWEKSTFKVDKDNRCCIEKIREIAFYKTTAALSFISDLKKYPIAQLARAVEYTDCTSAEG